MHSQVKLELIYMIPKLEGMKDWVWNDKPKFRIDVELDKNFVLKSFKQALENGSARSRELGS